MKIGVIGLGNIFQKAYLPAMLLMQDKVEWHFYTRKKEKAEALQSQYGLQHFYTDLNEWIASGIEAAFVHVATDVHGEIIRHLLEHGISVYVDKPISERLAETEALVKLAEEKGLLLTTGFNRRFAPMVQEIKKIPDKNMMVIQKNRVKSIKPVRYAIYDLFIHVVDTALYLLDDEIVSFQSYIVAEEGMLQRVWLTLETSSTSCFVSMNTAAGANEEVMEVQSPSGTARLVDLTEYTALSDGKKEAKFFGDWDATVYKRGFTTSIEQFVAGLQTQENPVSTSSSVRSHFICEEIIQQWEINQ